MLAASAIFFSRSVCGEKQWPMNGYYRGVEDRIREADLIVTGKLRIVEKMETGTEPKYLVKAAVDVEAVLIGDPRLKRVEFSSKYFPGGRNVFSQTQYFGGEDEGHCHLIECFPYGIRYPAVVFFKKDRETFAPFYAYIDDEKGSTKTAIVTIIEAERGMTNINIVASLETMISKKQSLIVKNYAIRASMKHLDWQARNDLFVSTRLNIAKDSKLYAYAIGCFAEYVHDESSSIASSGATLDVLFSLIDCAPDSRSMDLAVLKLTTKVVPILRNHEDKAEVLRTILIRKRGEFGQNKVKDANLSRQDQALLDALGTEAPVTDHGQGPTK